MSTDHATATDQHRTVLLPLQGSTHIGSLVRPDSRLYHRPRQEGALRAACGSFHKDGQAVARADAVNLDYAPCQRPQCFGAGGHDEGGEPA